MNWLELTEIESLDNIVQDSVNQSIIIYKHSNRCHICARVKNRIESQWVELNSEIPVYYLDLLKYRNISDRIAGLFNVEHQSPQLLLIKNGVCIYNESHGSISVDELKKILSEQKN